MDRVPGHAGDSELPNRETQVDSARSPGETEYAAVTIEDGANTMSEEHLTDEPPTRPAGLFSPVNLMTPKATAIAGFAFAVFSMLGQGSWSTALTTLFWGSSYEMGTVRNVMVVWGIGCLIMAGLGVWLAHTTLRVVEQAWEAHLARAAVLVAGMGAVLAILAIIGGLVHGG
jgi:hypothetical protein